MNLKITEEIRKIDEKLASVFKYLNLIRHVNPTNLEEEKEAFFASDKKRNPFFTYKEPRGDVHMIRKELINLKIPNTDLGKIFEKVRQDFLKRCEIISCIGHDDNGVRELTSEIYGWPNKGLIAYAKKIIEDYSDEPDEKFIPSETLGNEMRKILDSIGLNDWEIKYSKKYLTRTKHTRKLCISEKRFFSELDLYRLPVHEVCVHAVRYENSYYQPLKIFSYGFSGFLKTEEGMATYFEEQTGHSSSEVFRNYAGRVIAVNCLKENKEFKECFECLKDLGFSDDESWNLSVRAYRGGGFVKDHVYLEGYLSVKEFAKHGGDFKTLFVGKVGIEDLAIVESLLKKNVINKAKFLPPFLED